LFRHNIKQHSSEAAAVWTTDSVFKQTYFLANKND